MSNRIVIAEAGMEKPMAAEKTEVGKKSADQQNINNEKIEKGYGAAGKHVERKYKAVSRNGDTLELSEAGNRLGEKEAQMLLPGKRSFTGQRKFDIFTMTDDSKSILAENGRRLPARRPAAWT